MKAQLNLIRQIILSIFFCALFITGGVIIASLLGTKNKQQTNKPAKPPQIVVHAQKLKRQSFQDKLVGYGVANPLQTTNVEAEVIGVIKWISPLLEKGILVEKNSKLIELNDGDFQQTLKATQAALEQAQANILTQKIDLQGTQEQLTVAKREFSIAKRELARLRKLEKSQGVSKSVLDNQILQTALRERSVLQLKWREKSMNPILQRAQAEIKLRRVEIAKATKNLKRTVIYAPYTGNIASRFAQIGSRVGPNISLFSIVNRSKLEIPISLPASKFGNVKIGAKVSLKFREDGQVVWRGEVIRLSATIDTLNRTFQAFVTIEQKNDNIVIPPGIFVIGEVEGQYYQDVFVIPRTAFIENNVFVINKDSDKAIARKRVLAIDSTLSEYVIIQKGLQEGERLIITNVEELDHGSEVVVVKKEAS